MRLLEKVLRWKTLWGKREAPSSPKEGDRQVDRESSGERSGITRGGHLARVMSACWVIAGSCSCTLGRLGFRFAL